METKETPELLVKTSAFQDRLFRQCQSLLSFALKEGKELKNSQLKLLDGEPESYSGTPEQLLGLYNYLTKVVKPVSPRMVIHLEKTEQSSTLIRILGPLPIVRQFTILAMISLLAFMLTSLSKDINVDTIQLSILQGYGMSQVKRLVFLVACASVGASFYGLFKMNYLLNKRDFDLSLTHTYWSRYILGIVAGLLLSELFIGMIEPAGETADHQAPLGSIGYLLKPTLAILGGFSADLVYTILSRLVETIENLFKGNTGDAIDQKEAEMEVRHEAKAIKTRNTTAQYLLNLKQQLMQHGVPDESLAQLDDTLQKVTSDNGED